MKIYKNKNLKISQYYIIVGQLFPQIPTKLKYNIHQINIKEFKIN